MRRIGDRERQGRLQRRQAVGAGRAAGVAELTAPAEVADIARAVVVLHSTDPATVYLSCAARGVPSPAHVDAALYDDRSVLRLLGMRRTVFVAPTELVASIQHGTTALLLDKERQKVVRLLADGGVADAAAWYDRLERATLDALRRRDGAFGSELAAEVPELATRVEVGRGTRQATTIGLTTRVLFLLAARGLIVRGRPRGTWLSNQYQWWPTERWLAGCPEAAPDPVDARAALLDRYLARFGPVTMADVRWWTGWTARDARAALARLDVTEVVLDDGSEGLVLTEDLEDRPEPAPTAALLPALDPTAMGWKERGWYLGAHRAALFDRSGNIGPTSWWEGRIVGGWAQRPDGGIALRQLEDVGTDARRAIEAAAAAMASWIGDVRVTPRFRTPLERELVAG